MGIALSVAAFVATLALTRRALSLGVAALLTVGYAYGILRANFPDGFSHFMFDAAVAGLYLGHFTQRFELETRARSRHALFWLKALSIIPVVAFFVPLQHPLVQLVGLRAAIYFLPLVIVGARLDEADLSRLARWVAVLNGVALAFGLAQFFLGVDRFYPRNVVTDIIYRSTDVGEVGAFRIPATFPNAHAFGGNMLGTLPLLIGHWRSLAPHARQRKLVLFAIVASLTGVFMCGARSPVVLLFAFALATLLSGGLALSHKVALSGLALVMVVVVSTSERFQRFTTLTDFDYVQARVEGSANLGLVDLAFEYPLGAGLARAAGTSIPFFLADLASPHIGLENEYGRIVVEQGLPGLAIWLTFIAWTVTRRIHGGTAWTFGRLAMRSFLVIVWATAFIGTGMLTSVPGTAVVLLFMGQLAASTRSAVPGHLDLGGRRTLHAAAGRIEPSG